MSEHITKRMSGAFTARRIAGASWHIFMNGMTGTAIRDLVAFNNRLYAHTGYEVYQSTDAGMSWKKLWNHGQEAVLNIPTTKINYTSKLIPAGDILYSLAGPRRFKRHCDYFSFIY